MYKGSFMKGCWRESLEFSSHKQTWVKFDFSKNSLTFQNIPEKLHSTEFIFLMTQLSHKYEYSLLTWWYEKFAFNKLISFSSAIKMSEILDRLTCLRVCILRGFKKTCLLLEKKRQEISKEEGFFSYYFVVFFCLEFLWV